MIDHLVGRKVAVVVHNDVVSDARILKEVASLARAGAIVDIFGCQTKKDHVYPSTVPGARRLVLVDPSSGQVNAKDVYTPSDKLLLPALKIFKKLKDRKKKKRDMRRAAAVIGLLYLLALALMPILLVRLAMLGTPALALLVWPFSRKLLRSWVNWQYDRISPHVLPVHRYHRFHVIADALGSAIDAKDYDFVHCHDLIALICGARLKSATPRLRMIWDAHELYEHVAGYAPPDSARARKIIRSNISNADSVITISGSFAEYYAREFGAKHPRVVMNATVESDLPENDGRLHAACGLRPDQRILLFQGGLATHRGISQLLAASADLPEDWSVVFMGSGKLAPDIEARASELAALRPREQSAISLIPPAPHAELAKWTCGATIGVIPYENTSLNHLYCTPNKLWEYPNAGVPILATDLVEMGRIIREWKTGILLPREFGASDIVSAVRGVSDESLNEMRAACRRFSNDMSWTKFEGELYDAYR